MSSTSDRLKKIIRSTGERRLISEPAERGDNHGQTGGSQMVSGSGPREPIADGSQDAMIPGLSGELPPENPDPLKQRIHKRPPQSGVSRVAYNLWQRRPGRPLTEAEQAELAENKRRKAMERVLKEEADLFMDRITNALDRRELCYRYKKSEKDFFTSGVNSVSFDAVVMQPDAIYYRVDTRRLPRGVGILQLVDPDILTDLSLACGRRVTAEYTEKVGCWYILERATGVRGIPTHVKLIDLLNHMPATADGLTIPLGMTTNSRPVYRSLGDMYSMLVGGTIGAGKSNILNVILCSLIRRNSPDRVKLLMVDLKGGLEFSFYEGIPHLLSVPGVAEKGIVYYREQVKDLLAWLVHEGERRIEVIKKAGYKDIARYNQRNRKRHLPHLVFVVDEWADIKLEPKSGREAEDLLTNICQRFRAVGIHVIICTQVPKSEIVSTRIKGVLPAKLAFSCPTNQGSMAILDNGHAKGLEPAGRCVFQWQDEITIQTPYITDLFIQQTVQGAISGQYDDMETGHDVTPLEVQEYALAHDNGYLSRDRLYQVFRGRGLAQAEITRWLAEWEGEEFIIGSSVFRVEPPAGPYPRRLVAVVDDDNETNEGNEHEPIDQ